jgi:hypothetical protein
MFRGRGFSLDADATEPPFSGVTDMNDCRKTSLCFWTPTRITPEAKSLGPDGEPCRADTRGLLQRAHIVANWPPIYIGNESDRHWEEGEDLSLLDFKAIEYKRRGYAIADDEQRVRIADGPKREFKRRGVNQHALEKICRGEAVDPLVPDEKTRHCTARSRRRSRSYLNATIGRRTTIRNTNSSMSFPTSTQLRSSQYIFAPVTGFLQSAAANFSRRSGGWPVFPAAYNYKYTVLICTEWRHISLCRIQSRACDIESA